MHRLILREGAAPASLWGKGMGKALRTTVRAMVRGTGRNGLEHRAHHLGEGVDKDQTNASVGLN